MIRNNVLFCFCEMHKPFKDQEQVPWYHFSCILLFCDGISIRKQLSHLKSMKRAQRHGNPNFIKNMRRYNIPNEPSVILGPPSFPHHLPAAEPILPGHTLIRPAMGMLKSSIKFPHRELENGSGVYGQMESLGIKYDGMNDRVLYTGFRRSEPLLQKQFSRRSMNDYESPRGRRHLLLWPLQDVKPKQPLLKLSDSVNKVLTIFPSQIQMKNLKAKKRLKSPKIMKKRFVRHFDLSDESDETDEPWLPNQDLHEAILFTNMKMSDMEDIFSLIKSLRRGRKPPDDSDSDNPKLLYVPGTANYGDFSVGDSEPETGVPNKTAMFWKTKNEFNHIKINHEAPEHIDLLPADAASKPKPWWFYHQSDFENLEEENR